MLLVRTPSPHPTESLIGYVLRVSETNGYSSQSEVLEAAGISGKYRNRKMDMDIGKLAYVLGKPVEELQPLLYATRHSFKMEGVLLGQTMSAHHHRLAKPMFCPQCVSERGFIEALWDSALVIACPRHRCELLGACPSCGRHFGTYRKGLLMCMCGGNLLGGELPPVANEISDLMAILATKILGESGQSNSYSGMPVTELSAMSLRNLQMAITNLGSQQLFSQGVDRNQPMTRVVAAAAQVFSDWPNNFYSLLRNIGKISAAKEPFTTGFMKRHASIHQSIFKKEIPPDEIKFLREAFVRYGLEQWNEGIVRFKSKVLNGISFERKWMSRREIAAHLGVGLSMVSKLQKTGRFAIERDEKTRSSHLFADRSKIGLPIASPGRSLGEREAAKFLGIPFAVLRALREGGDFEIKRLAIPLSAYHEADLIAFAKKLSMRALAVGQIENVGRSFVTTNKAQGILTLTYILKNYSFKSISGSASVIHALLAGRIKAMGIEGDVVGGLLIDFEDVRPLMLESRHLAMGKTLSQKEVSSRIECDLSIIPNLVHAGHLKSVRESAGTRIVEKSLIDFSSAYVSLAAIGKEHRVASRVLIKMCESNGFPLLNVPRRNPALLQPFLSREHEQNLRILTAQHRQGHPWRAK